MTTKLRANQAQTIAEAEAAYDAAKRELEERKLERDALRERYAERVPLGKVITAGGVTIKRRIQSTGQRFSLKGYLEKHKLTKAMRPFVSEGEYEVWDVRPAPAKASGASGNGKVKRMPKELASAVDGASAQGGRKISSAAQAQ